MNYYIKILTLPKQVKILSDKICFVVGGKTWDSCIYKQIYTINKKNVNSMETNTGKKHIYIINNDHEYINRIKNR